MKPRILPILALLCFSIVSSCGDNESKKEEDSEQRPTGSVKNDSGKSSDSNILLDELDKLCAGIYSKEIQIGITPIQKIQDLYADHPDESNLSDFAFNIKAGNMEMLLSFAQQGDTLSNVFYSIRLPDIDDNKMIRNEIISKLMAHFESEGTLEENEGLISIIWELNEAKFIYTELSPSNIQIYYRK